MVELLLLFYFVLMAAVAFVIYFFVYRKIFSRASESDLGGGNTPIEISAESFEKAYEADENSFKNKYNNKKIRITGTISKIECKKNKYFVLVLGNNIECFFDYEVHKDTISVLKIGQKLVIVGIYVYYDGSRQGLTRCYIQEILSIR